MFHKVRFCRSFNLTSFVCYSVVFFNTKTNHKVFDSHFLSLMLKVILEVHPTRRQFFNDCCHLECFTQIHPF
ncbi:hypothetical protein Hanom_Chr01g00083401 [Helianthus anomalus]